MLQITCPYCGVRPENEFTYGGPARVERPSLSADDAQWADYLYFRDNPRGPHAESWCHAYGCSQWFDIVRNTVTHEILSEGDTGGKTPAGGQV